MVSPNPRFISSVRNQGEYFDEEILEKVNNKIIPQPNSKTHLMN